MVNYHAVISNYNSLYIFCTHSYISDLDFTILWIYTCIHRADTIILKKMWYSFLQNYNFSTYTKTAIIATTQIGYEHYTHDANGNLTLVENDSLNTERRMYWDEDNRLMVLSDNGKTSRYTYNAGGERIIKSHGDLEGVYINGAPQGITFHETEDYTIYPAPIITVTKNRFTKHYFIGDKRVASKLGTGKFSNVYGISGNNVTAGQKDYAARMMQIEKQREEYYKLLGTPPGVPTMKGATADPDNTGYGYNTIIGELGDHSVPEGWIQRPKFNEKGDVPGPPIQWQKPEDPDNAQPGYGYIPADTTNIEDIFFYHSDHLGSTSYITDAKANITQFDAYLPYGELLIDEHSSSEDMPYKFNGKELDQETGLYYYGARYMNPVTSLWYGVDPLKESYSEISSYLYYHDNPVKLVDVNGMADEESSKTDKRKGVDWKELKSAFSITLSVGAQIGVEVGTVGASMNFNSTNYSYDLNGNTDQYRSSGLTIGMGAFSFQQENEYHSTTSLVTSKEDIYKDFVGFKMKTGSVERKEVYKTELVTKESSLSVGKKGFGLTIIGVEDAYQQTSTKYSKTPIVKSTRITGVTSSFSKQTTKNVKSKSGSKTGVKVSAILGVEIGID